MQRSIILMLFIAVVLVYPTASYAQLPSCTGNNIVNYVTGNVLYNYDPALPISATNPSVNTLPALPAGTVGICVSQNINGPGPSPTFYVVASGGLYWYYNGTAWVNTGHTAGSVNPGGGGNIIYNLGGANVYTYNGTGNATLLTTIPGFSGVADIQADATNGFYVLQLLTPQSMRYYNSAGVLTQTWTVTGSASGSGGGGFAIIGSDIYANNGLGLQKGVITGTNINFTMITPTGLSPSPQDFATCGASVLPSVTDTVYYCGSGSGVTLSVPGSGPYNWTVASGPATITGSGSTVVVNTTGTSVITRQNTSSTPPATHTTTIIVPTANLNAGVDVNIAGCTPTSLLNLNGTLTGTTAGIPYTLNWTPAASVTANGTTLTPTVSVGTGATTFTLTASVPASYGGCTFSDNMNVNYTQANLTANFSSVIKYGCSGDSVAFTNTSTGGATNYGWSFGNNTYSNTVSPTIFYPVQGVYTVKLVTSNATCRDSVTKTIDTRHALDAAFTADNDSICINLPINFTNTSTASTINSIAPQYTWDFGDNTTATTTNPSHAYTNPGIYRVRLVVKDFVPCYDTAYMTVVVDSAPHLELSLSDTILCEGQRINFYAVYNPSWLYNVFWNFGDGSLGLTGGNVTHAYDTSGVFTVSITGKSRTCPEVTVSKDLTVKPFPKVNIGPDTFLCPNSPPIKITETVNAGNANARYLWNTGATGSSITVNQTGTFSATVSIDGCATTDSIVVQNDCYLIIPNSFTPNGDGMNDFFFPEELRSHAVISFRMSVYNRWGQLVYRTASIHSKGWDGTLNDEPQPTEVYVYMLEAGYSDGRKETYKGNVTLLR